MNDNDVIRGAGAIHKFCCGLLEPPPTLRQIYNWIERGDLPGGKLAGQLVCSKSELRQHIARLVRAVRRQGFRDNGLGKLREALAHRIGEVRRPAVGAASGG